MAPKGHSRGGGHALRVIRNVYLYLVAMIGLIVFVVGTVGLVNNVLENYVFQVDEDRYYALPLDGGVCSKFYNPDPTSSQMLERTDEEIAECEAQIEEQNQRNRDNNIKRELASSISSIVVGLPLWLLHWGIIQREYSRKKKRLLAKK